MEQVAEARSSKTLSEVAIKMFMNIAGGQWKLNDGEMMVLLGAPSRATFYKWKKGTVHVLSHDTLERVSYISGIYKSLRLLLPSVQQSNDWIRKPSSDFNGKSALEIMMAGSIVDLAYVRNYLDYMRG